MRKVFTIGFTEKPAQRFFELLRMAKVRRIIDVRLNNVSQLAGFAKRDDLRFFLKEMCGSDYMELRELAPEPGMLKDFRNKTLAWERYAARYVDLLAQRAVERTLQPELFDHACLLCSEHKPHHCHRRLALEYLNTRWGPVLQIEHLF
jgi:uncharacterized protein (DUF488 family)